MVDLPIHEEDFMAKISIDVDEIKKNLKTQALNAKTQFSDFAKKAQKDLEHTQVFKRVESALEKVKAHELTQEVMKNPKVQEITKRLVAASEQLEKAITKNAATLIEEVKARVGKTSGRSKESTTTKKSKKTNTEN
jgi:hypothetical protein